MNVAVLQLNLSLDKTNTERSKLLADNAALQSQYSSLVASRAIKQEAVKQFGLVLPGSVRVRERREVMRDKQANRRIRLLLVIFALVFAATLARAVWLQGVRAATLGRMAERQHRETVVVPAGRGTIFDTNGVQLAIGEQTKTIYADPRELADPRAVAIAAHRILGVDANQLYPQLLNRKTALRLRRSASPTR